MKAVILAAGQGLRLREQHTLPKGFIKIQKNPIILESIQRLKQHAIHDILLVTGYHADYYNSLAQQTRLFHTVHNPHYHDRGSLYSLYCARDWLDDDCLLLESDLIYEPRALAVLLSSSHNNSLLVSGATYSGDEIYVAAQQQRLTNMSKNIQTLTPTQIMGEFVGISKLSLEAFTQLIQMIASQPELRDNGHYEEQGLVCLAQQTPITCLKVSDLLWSEIDNEAHLQRATIIHTEIQAKCRQRNILLNPGPVTTSDQVKQALVVPDICHREQEFIELLQSIRQDLLRVVHATTDYTSILFAASGTGALEACLSSVVPAQQKIAIINNGAYGQRLVDIANCHHLNVVEFKYAFDQPLPLASIEAALIAHPSIRYLAMVHHETSSGVLNPLRAMGQLCHRTQCTFIVDAMSSFAGTDINVHTDHITYLISSANKCLHGMPGISFIICQVAHLLKTANQARSYYFNLHQQYHSLEKNGEMLFTPPVQIAYALKQALREYFAEGANGRITRYQTNYNHLINGLKNLGFTCITPEFAASNLLAIIQFPQDDINQYDFNALHDHLYHKKCTIYPRKLDIPNTFRIACIGDLTLPDIEYFLNELTNYLIHHHQYQSLTHGE